MAEFIIAIEKTLRYEGGLIDRPDDPGGITNFGIAKNAHPELRAEEIRMMTRVRAIGIYRYTYWHDLYSQIHDQAIANSLFDFGVTSRVRTAIKLMQKTLDDREEMAHGIMNDYTISTINGALKRNLKVDFTVARLKFYVALGKPEFLDSWFSRTIDALL